MHYEANVVSNTLTSLTSGSPYTLNGNSSATGDVTWAFQWDLPIAANHSSQFSKNIVIQVPEPSTWLLVGMAATLIGLFAKRRLTA